MVMGAKREASFPYKIDKKTALPVFTGITGRLQVYKVMAPVPPQMGSIPPRAWWRLCGESAGPIPPQPLPGMKAVGAKGSQTATEGSHSAASASLPRRFRLVVEATRFEAECVILRRLGDSVFVGIL
jgi:hypothetical protein